MAKVFNFLSQEIFTQRNVVKSPFTASKTSEQSALKYQIYEKYACETNHKNHSNNKNNNDNEQRLEQQKQHVIRTTTAAAATTTTATEQNISLQHFAATSVFKPLYNEHEEQQQEMQLTSNNSYNSLSFGFLPALNVLTSVSVPSSYMNMSLTVFAYAANTTSTLELKPRKFQLSKLHNQIGNNFDTRILYLTLLVLIYCCVLVRTPAAGANATMSALHSDTTMAAVTMTAVAQQHIPTSSDDNKTDISDENTLYAQTGLKTSLAIADTVATNANNIDILTSSHSAALNKTNLLYSVTLSDRNMPISRANTTTNLHEHASSLLLKRDTNNVPDDDDNSNYHDDEFDDDYDALINNKSAKGKYVGAPCNDMKCEPRLLHVICDKETLTCGCAKNYPVKLGPRKGCGKPKKLGEQCFYDASCIYNDENSLCVQVRHNALCECVNGFHSVSYTKPTRKVFCTQDLKELTSDLPTLLGVTTGIAVLAGLICMVLHLFSKTKYPRHRNFGDANLPPPIMYSSDTGIPLTVQSGRPSSRSSIRSSGSMNSIIGGGHRRASTSGIGASKGILVSTSRTGSRRPSLASVHSTSSSVRSYSMMRFEKETQQREIRQEMKLRLARLQQQQQLNQNKPQIIIGDAMVHHGTFSRLHSTMATPSPLTPNSTDELLPSVDEMQEYPTKPDKAAIFAKDSVIDISLTTISNIIASTSGTSTTVLALPTTTTAATTTTTASSSLSTASSEILNAVAYNGPCSSSTEAL